MDKFDFSLHNLHNPGALKELAQAGLAGFQFAGATMDIVILQRKRSAENRDLQQTSQSSKSKA